MVHGVRGDGSLERCCWGQAMGMAVLYQLSSGALQDTARTWGQRACRRPAGSLGSLMSLL